MYDPSKQKLVIYCSTPFVFLSIVVTFINDHYLKSELDLPWLTGKLSDFSGLFFAPFFLEDLFFIRAEKVGKKALIRFLIICLTVALIFSAINTSEQAAALYRNLLWQVSSSIGFSVSHTLDPADCWGLLSLILSYLYYQYLQNSQQRI